MGSRTCVGTTDISPPVKNNTDRMNQLVRVDIPTRGGGPCDRESHTCVGTTDVSPPVKNITDRMNQLFGLMFLLGWKSV